MIEAADNAAVMLRISCLGFCQMKDDPKSPSCVRCTLRVDFSLKYLSDFQQIDLSAFELYKINEA